MRNPGALERLAILNVPHPACFEREVRRWRQLRRSWYMLFFQLPWLPEKLLGLGGGRRLGEMFARTAVHPERFGPEVQRVYAENAMRPGALSAMVHYYRAMARGGARRQRALGYPPIETPTLLIWGEQDVALAKETTFGTGEYVKDLTVRYLPEASHWVQQDAPDEVNAILEAWILGRKIHGYSS
jgi:pimeloyl-ACP methyl ester carboxylesterase